MPAKTTLESINFARRAAVAGLSTRQSKSPAKATSPQSWFKSWWDGGKENKPAAAFTPALTKAPSSRRRLTEVPLESASAPAPSIAASEIPPGLSPGQYPASVVRHIDGTQWVDATGTPPERAACVNTMGPYACGILGTTLPNGTVTGLDTVRPVASTVAMMEFAQDSMNVQTTRVNAEFDLPGSNNATQWQMLAQTTDEYAKRAITSIVGLWDDPTEGPSEVPGARTMPRIADAGYLASTRPYVACSFSNEPHTTPGQPVDAQALAASMQLAINEFRKYAPNNVIVVQCLDYDNDVLDYLMSNLVDPGNLTNRQIMFEVHSYQSGAALLAQMQKINELVNKGYPILIGEYGPSGVPDGGPTPSLPGTMNYTDVGTFVTELWQGLLQNTTSACAWAFENFSCYPGMLNGTNLGLNPANTTYEWTTWGNTAVNITKGTWPTDFNNVSPAPPPFVTAIGQPPPELSPPPVASPPPFAAPPPLALPPPPAAPAQSGAVAMASPSTLGLVALGAVTLHLGAAAVNFAKDWLAPRGRRAST